MTLCRYVLDGPLFESWQGQKPVLHNVRNCPGAHPASCSMCTRLLSRLQSSRTHLLEPRLRMSGAIPLLPLHAVMTWTEIKLPFIH